MPGSFHLFGGRHGGLLGRPEQDPQKAHVDRIDVETAASLGILKLATAVGGGWNARQESWWDTKLSEHDQGQLGDCVGFATCRDREMARLAVGHAYLPLSEMWIYREWQRKYEPTQIGTDTGGFGAWAETILAGRGLAFAADYPGFPGSGVPYPNPSDATALLAALAANPSPSPSYGPALWQKNIVPVTVSTDQTVLKSVLVAKKPILVGFVVCASFESVAQGTGNVPLPMGPSDPVLGGHENARIGWVPSATYPNGVTLPRGATGYYVQLNSWLGFSPENLLYVPDNFDTAPSPDGSGPMLMDAVAFALAPAA